MSSPRHGIGSTWSNHVSSFIVNFILQTDRMTLEPLEMPHHSFFKDTRNLYLIETLECEKTANLSSLLQLMGTELNTKRSSLPGEINEKYAFIHTNTKNSIIFTSLIF